MTNIPLRLTVANTVTHWLKTSCNEQFQASHVDTQRLTCDKIEGQVMEAVDCGLGLLLFLLHKSG